MGNKDCTDSTEGPEPQISLKSQIGSENKLKAGWCGTAALGCECHLVTQLCRMFEIVHVEG